MSARAGSDDLETLFSFELLVESVRVEGGSPLSHELALGVRLLDFPTLLVHRPQRSRGGDVMDQQGEYAFNRGKCGFFKMNLNSLHATLSSTPLYVMVLDLKEEIPKLVGTSLISLARAMDSISQDVSERGVSSPSSHGERGVVGICNLTGESIGSISLSYKLLSLGAGLLPTGPRSTSVHGGERVHHSILVKHLPESSGNVCPTSQGESDVRRDVRNNKPSNEETLMNEDERHGGPMPRTLGETESNSDEDLTVFRPPPLFYSNSAEEKKLNEGGDRKLETLDPDAFTFVDTCSEESTSSPVVDRRVGRENPPGDPEASEVTPNVLGEALRQLPLLNALLVELSQLNGQRPRQPASIHPNLSWIYRPASAGDGNASRKEEQAELLQGTGPHFKPGRSPRCCSTPVARPASVKAKDKREEALIEGKSSSKSPRKRLVYGTTKTFDLRLKRISPLKVKRRECTDLRRNETQSSVAKRKTKSSSGIVKPGKGKPESRAPNPSSSLNENVETMMQSLAVDSALRETITLKRKTLRGKVHGEQDGDSPRISQTPSLSERGLKCTRVPSVDGDNVAQSKDEKERHSESNQVEAQAEADGHGEEIESPGSGGRGGGIKSSFSDSSGEGKEEADYADDFNSLQPSDAFSPDSLSSPQSSGAETPRSPVRLDFCNSDSERFRRRAVLPVPVKAPGSPQRALRATRVIRPRTHASALSFSSSSSSSSEDGDGSGSLQTVCSRKTTMTDSSRAAGGLVSSRGQRSGSTKNSGHVRGFSPEPLEVEELEDDLGSLDFKKEYQHISELVANKLPGYTM